MELSSFLAQIRKWATEAPHRVFEVLKEMEDDARSRGASAAPMMALALRELISENKIKCSETLILYLGDYGSFFPEAFAEAILPQLSAHGPPEVVSLLGNTGVVGVLSKLKARLDLSFADDDLLVALAGALGDIGGKAAMGWLDELDASSTTSPRVRDEIRSAREFEARRQVETRQAGGGVEECAD